MADNQLQQTAVTYISSSQSLKIKTRSIENTLIPLVNQISTLVNFKDTILAKINANANAGASLTLTTPATAAAAAAATANALFSERATSALLKVGEAVNLAVERFVQVGEAIAYDHPTIRFDMLETCREARAAGHSIRVQTQSMPSNSLLSLIAAAAADAAAGNKTPSNADNITLMQAANVLLNSVTKVLLLADIVLINQILGAKNRVFITLSKLESGAPEFPHFLSLFSQYGADLIELAHLSGERQADLKDERRRAQLASARWILEKSTVMILSATKVHMKHLECECARENIGLVYSFIYSALDTLHYVVVDSGSLFDLATSTIYNNSIFRTGIVENAFAGALRQFEDALELAKNNMNNSDQAFSSNENLVLNTMELLVDSTQDFTDSAYTGNEQRERIVRLQNEIRDKTRLFVAEEEEINRAEQNEQTLLESTTAAASSNIHLNRIARYNRLLVRSTPVLNDCEVLRKLLHAQCMQEASELFHENQDATLLHCIKTYALSNHYDLLIDSLDKFKEYSDHVLEICRLLRHISPLDVFEVTCEHHYNVFDNFSKMIHSSAGTAALYPTCKSAIENLNLYGDNWQAQINDLSVLVKEMAEFASGVKSSKSVYLSLPRPGKHGNHPSLRSSSSSILNGGGGGGGSSSSSVSPAPSRKSDAETRRLDSAEQARMAKLGLEMKLLQKEIEAEANKWNEPQNEIVQIAKLMSEMAFEIHLFTRGEGRLRTTQDLFARADIFLQHGVVLYGVVKEFLAEVPAGYLRDEVSQIVERVPVHYKQLKNRVKQQTVGKTATFNKVDGVIQETRDFMNLVTKLVTNCFLCCTKYNINYDQKRAELADASNLNPEYFLGENQQLCTATTTNNINSSSETNHLKSFVAKTNSNNQPKTAIDTTLIEECLLAAINSNNITRINSNKFLLRNKTGGSSSTINTNNPNPHHRFSNYLTYSSSSSTQSPACRLDQLTADNAANANSRSGSCGPAFRNSLSGGINLNNYT